MLGQISQKRKNYFKEKAFIWSLIIYPVACWLIFFVGTTTHSIWLAFQEYDLNTQTFVYKGFDNIFQVIRDVSQLELMKTCLKNSLLLWGISIFINLPINLLMSFFIYKKVYFYKFFTVVMFLPSIVSSMVWILIYKYFLEWGLPLFLNNEQFVSPLIDTSTNLLSMLAFNEWLALAGGLVIYTGAMSRVPISLVEYGKIDGLSALKEFIYITLPLIFPTISVVLVTGIIGIFNSTLPTYGFFGADAEENLYTIGYWTFIMTTGESSPVVFPYAAAICLVVSVVAAPITLLVKAVLDKVNDNLEY